MPRSPVRPSPPDPSKIASGKPGAVHTILQREFADHRAACIAAAVIVVGAADHDPDRRVDEITEIGSLDVVVEPTNRIQGDRRPHVHAGPEHRIAVVLRHHQQRLDAAHRLAEQPYA
jgi:hypothetical protein